MATIGKVSAVFTASTSGLKAGVQDAGSSLRRLTGDVSAMRGSLRSLTAISAAQLFTQITGGAINAGRSLLSMAQAEIEVIDRTGKLADRLGMTFAEMSSLSYAGKLADVSLETIAKAATRADIALVKAADGSQQAQAAFTGVGLTLEDLQGKTAAERFEKIVDAVAALPTPAEKAAASVKLFGKAGADLLPLFEGGAGGIRDAAREAERFGLALTKVQRADIDAIDDSFVRAKAAISGVVQQVTAKLAPAITGIVDQFSDFIGDVGGATIGDRIGEGIIAGARELAAISDDVIRSFGATFSDLKGIVAGLKGGIDVGRRATNALGGVFSTFKGSAAAIGGVSMMPFAGVKDVGGTLAAGASGQDVVDAYKKAADEGFAAAANQFREAFMPREKLVADFGAPVTGILEKSLARLRPNGGPQDQAERQNFRMKPPEPPPTKPIDEQIRAIDSRSKEGVAEMFRLMRGTTEDLAQKQLDELRKINENTADGGIDVEELGFAL